MTEESSPLRVSVVVRCFDEVEHIGRLLAGLEHQTWPDVEIVVVDSGSTDGTLDVVGRHEATVLHITPEEFSFGRSLNRGCEAATGDILVFISAHCYPTHDDWLEQMLEPFHDPSVQVVYGKQRGDERTRFSEHRVFEQWFPDASDGDQDHPFTNNANCAVRRARWLASPYDERLSGLEDIAWSKSVLEEGGRIVYSAAAEVAHVHEETPARIFNRYRREGIAFHRIFPSERFGIGDFVRFFLSSVAGDARVAARERSLLREGWGIVVFRFMQYWGTYRGFAHHGPMESALKRKLYYPHPPGMKHEKQDSAPKGRPIPYAQVGAQLPRD